MSETDDEIYAADEAAFSEVDLLRRLLHAERRQVRLLETISTQVGQIVAVLVPQPSSEATALTLTITGGTMSQFTVDTTDGVATLQFVDDHEDPTTGPADSVTGQPVVPALDSDNSAILSVGPATPGSVAGATTFALTPVAVGVATLTPQPLLNSDGTPVLEADGVTPFGVPAAQQVTIVAGEATGLTMSVTG